MEIRLVLFSIGMLLANFQVQAAVNDGQLAVAAGFESVGADGSSAVVAETQNDMRELQFQRAISAVENRDYETLQEILDDHPYLIDYAADPECSLLCEFSFVLRGSGEGDSTPYIDEIAIALLLDRVADPKKAPHAIDDLLSGTDNFNSDETEYPIESGLCLENRNRLFPLVNRMIKSGSPLGTLREYDFIGSYTTAFFYVYYLCDVLYVCGAAYEIASPEVARSVSAALLPSEYDWLEFLVSSRALSKGCVSRIVFSQFDL